MSGERTEDPEDPHERLESVEERMLERFFRGEVEPKMALGAMSARTPSSKES